ncbi:hypothetical protein, partial [Oceanibaculum indicum]|uniref:hypothetical protein n=1 Tax=Oceanibaculum indicum TaxID=526216 RepID=UPI001ED98AF6
MTEAAQANRDGLECSSYTWQVRHEIYAGSLADCQGYLAFSALRSNVAALVKYKYINSLGWNRGELLPDP